jgi:hypothetical protein
MVDVGQRDPARVLVSVSGFDMDFDGGWLAGSQGDVPELYRGQGPGLVLELLDVG